MRVRIRGGASFPASFGDAFRALHDGVFDGHVQRIGPRLIALSFDSRHGLPDLELRLTGRGFRIDSNGDDRTVRGGVLTKVSIREGDAPGREVASFDRLSVPLVELDRAIRRADRGQGPDDPDTFALWRLFAGLGINYVSPDRVAEQMMGAFGGPGFIQSLGASLDRWGLDGDDRVVLSRLADFWHAGEGDDRVDGRGGDDRLFGDGGDDSLTGGGGGDELRGGDGDDRLNGGAGADFLQGDGGNDRIVLGAGADFGDGGAGRDTMLGGGGADTLYGQQGNDRIEGGGGDDSLRGSEGRDTLSGGGGDDVLEGGAGNDVLRGDGGDDRITDDIDTLRDNVYPGAFNDRMDGGPGDDTLSSFAGNDVLTGGPGRDRFEFWYGESFFDSGPNTFGGMSARITDYQPGLDDVLVASRVLDVFEAARRAAIEAEDEEWWREFFFPDPDGDGAVFHSPEDRFRLEIDGMAATRAEFDGLFFAMV